ncbi:MAG TPA: hypothetical protein GX509_09135 [Firmicutes bacterium]|nr:hypothetical protein [Bacillota bacterium]HHY98890.1 hypothetical protein [Bacillota bacterium]
MADDDYRLFSILRELVLSRGQSALTGDELLEMLSLLNLLGIVDLIRSRRPANLGCVPELAHDADDKAVDAPGTSHMVSSHEGTAPDLISIISNLAGQLGLGDKVSPAMIQTMASLLANQMSGAGQRKLTSLSKPAAGKSPPEKTAVEKSISEGDQSKSPQPATEGDQTKSPQKAETHSGEAREASRDSPLDWRKQWKRG